MKRVFFDESGNTGQDLLNAADPILTLSSCCFDPDQEEALLRHFSKFRGPELKFARLRKWEAGRRAILAYLEAPELTPSSAACFVTHKRFMVVTKYCDIVLEPSIREAGMDFYERGCNIATANLLATTMPVFLNPKTWDSFLAAFVRLIRERSRRAFDDFLRLAELIRSHLEHSEPDMVQYIAASLLLDPDELLPMLAGDELDPLVPAYHVLADQWGKRLGERYEIVADKSKALATERVRLLEFSSGDLVSFRAGYDRRTVEFPLKVASIALVDSRSEKQVQLADVIGGAVARIANSGATCEEGSFENRIFRACTDKHLITGGVWPTKKLDPEALETDETPTQAQINLPTYATMIAQKDPSTRTPKAGSPSGDP